MSDKVEHMRSCGVLQSNFFRVLANQNRGHSSVMLESGFYNEYCSASEFRHPSEVRHLP